MKPFPLLHSQAFVPYLDNQVFPSLDKVEDKLSQGLVELCSAPERLRSLTFFPHLRPLPLNAT